MKVNRYILWFLMILFWVYDSHQKIESYQDFLGLKARYEAFITGQRVGQPNLYPQEYLLKTWIQQAQECHCQMIKVHPWFPDAKTLHFSLELQGEYESLLIWVKKVHQILPKLHWDKMLLGNVHHKGLSMQVDCYEAI